MMEIIIGKMINLLLKQWILISLEAIKSPQPEWRTSLRKPSNLVMHFMPPNSPFISINSFSRTRMTWLGSSRDRGREPEGKYHRRNAWNKLSIEAS